jgi:serine phosphatase RsbU (regulator of sigma subunit)
MAGRRAAGVPGARPVMTGVARRLVVAAFVLIVVAIVADLLSGPGTTFSPLLAAVPVLAGTMTRRARVPLLSGGAAFVLVGVLAVLNPGVPVVVHVIAAVTVLAVTLASTATVVLMAARERELATVRTVAEATQKALLRPVAPRIGDLRIAVRYVAAEAEARVGGDLYEVLDTPFGIRLFLGDVRGKGLEAVETATDVLGVFRDAARSEPDPTVVARRLDATLARRPDTDAGLAEFVTAVLVEIPDEGSAVVVNCGHPPPLLLHAGRVAEVRPPRYCPPLALLGMMGDTYPARRFPLAHGDELLLYTDGVSETRDSAGRFYPLAERLGAMPWPDPDELLDRLLSDVRDYAGGGLDDDVAVLAVRREW